MKKLKEILLIDDSRGTNSLNKRLLEEMNVVEKIHTASNGKIALEYLQQKNEKGNYPCPNLIFLDINMPVMDGYQFLEAYKKIDKDQKAKNIIIMLTTSIREIDINKAQNYEAVIGYQFKPLTREKVNHILAQIN